jgi:hypothetical protein
MLCVADEIAWRLGTAPRPPDRRGLLSTEPSPGTRRTAGADFGTVPTFFVPHTTNANDAEQAYSTLAAFAGSRVLPMEERIFAITFHHDGTEWIAEVGSTLRGVLNRRRQRSGRMVNVTEHASDRATVLAIFLGDPYLVVTDARPLGQALSSWVNPFMAGRPLTVTFFQSGS